MHRKTSRLALAAIGLFGISIPALATLGGDAASVQADLGALNGTLHVSPQSGSTVYEIAAPSGTTIREYLSSAGAVYAVSWEGPVLPDLRQVLGSYFPAYVETSRAQGPARPLVVQQPGFVFESAGSMRAFFGKAYVPRLLPAGVCGDAIR